MITKMAYAFVVSVVLGVGCLVVLNKITRLIKAFNNKESAFFERINNAELDFCSKWREAYPKDPDDLLTEWGERNKDWISTEKKSDLRWIGFWSFIFLLFASTQYIFMMIIFNSRRFDNILSLFLL